MRIGDMRHEMRIEKQTATLDGAGQPLSSWTVVATVRCAVMRTPGAELWASSGRNERVPTVFRIRYLTGVVVGMRAVHDGKIYDIKSVVDQAGKRAEMDIVAVETGAEP